MISLVPALALAATDRAVLVGSNRAGPGQTDLQWADADADRIRAALEEVGGFRREDIEVLVDPDAATLLAAVDRASADLRDAGPASRFVFYYSGHARSQVLSLGPEELSVAGLEDRLDRVPAQQRLVMFDACQAGEPGGAKGVTAEAAFSYVSVAGRSTTGTAVVASSTADELSQESPRLGGSMFTHNWVTGLRGAANVDRDGVVTLDEAYDYAYDRTVVDTSATAIGTQHPTLRVERSGHGAWILTRPSPEIATLALPRELAGDITVVRQPSGRVVAEVAKQAADEVRLSVSAGTYEVTIRVGDEGRVCLVAVDPGQTVAVGATGCPPLRVTTGSDKGPTAVATGSGSGGFERRATLSGRAGLAPYPSLLFYSADVEATIRVDPHLSLLAGVSSYNVKEVLPPAVQLSTGVYSEWRTIWPLHAGLVYGVAPTARTQPWVGADAIGVQIFRNERGSWWSGGARARAGVDLLVTRSFGVQASGALGGWTGTRWPAIDPRAPTQGPLGELGLGLVVGI